MPANMRQHLPNMPQFEMPQFDMPALPQCLSELLRGPTGIPGLLLLLLRQELIGRLYVPMSLKYEHSRTHLHENDPKNLHLNYALRSPDSQSGIKNDDACEYSVRATNRTTMPANIPCG
eukprot:1181218-Prorocentrum_minimum.AAC.1